MIKTIRHFIWLLVIAVAGCTPTDQGADWADPRPLGRGLRSDRASPPDPGNKPQTYFEPSGKVALRQVLAAARLRNPGLRAYAWEVRAADARALQAGLLPNPKLKVEAEEIAGSGGGSAFDTAELSIQLSQLVELGGKRSARTRVAAIGSRLASWDYETKRLAVLTEATLGFIDVLAAQERLLLIKEIVRLSEKTLVSVTERVDAGKVSPLEKTKASVELANKKIELQKTESGLRSARKRLASTWGSTAPRFSKAVGAMDRVSDIPAYESVQALLGQNPNIARWAQEMEQRLAALALARARRVPNLTVGLGVQRFEETNDHALTFGLSLPLPLFDRNQGGVLEAHHRLAQLSHQRKSAEVRTSTALAESYETLVSARNEAIGLRDEVVPGATKAFDAAREGYQQGKFGYLEVLDAQRTLFEARGRFLNALARYHRSVAVVESLIGTNLDSIQDQNIKEL